MEIAQLGVDLGIINKAGSWLTFTSIENQPKFQGMEKVRLALKENPEWYEKIKSEVYELMGVKV